MPIRLLIALALAGGLGGCRRAPAVAPAPATAVAAAPRTLRDTMGRSLTVPATVRRVVSLSPSTTEVLFAIGAGPLIVGVDAYSDFPAAAAAIERVGSDIDPSLERLLALRPDVVFAAKTANPQRTVEAIERLGLPVYVSRTDSIAAILDDVVAMAAAVGRPAEGERLRAELAARIARVQARLAGRPAVPALVVVWPEPLIVAGGGSHVDEALRLAGGDNIARESPQPYPAFSLERMVKRAPAVVIVGTHADANRVAPPAFARLTTVPAVRDRRVFSVDGDLLFRPGPRVVDGIERLAALLHPDPADGGAR